MTNKEFFLKVLGNEVPVIIKVIERIPPAKSDWKPHERARTAGDIASQLAMMQPAMISMIVKDGVLDFSKMDKPKDMKFSDAVKGAQKAYDGIRKDIEAMDDDEWDTGMATMKWEGGEWKTEKFDMIWGLLFDAIHHRGQLTTYLRIMGEKVPGVYGGSGDEKPGA